jgi:hypothetical protein
LSAATVQKLPLLCPEIRSLGLSPCPVNQDLPIFKHLETLVAECRDNDVKEWKSQVVRVLRNAPNLHTLSLSVSKAVFVDRSHDESDDASDDDESAWADGTFKHVFDDICKQYEDTGAAPLRLTSLRCGTAACPFDKAALMKLTDLSYLEQVHIQNEDVYMHGIPYLTVYADVDDEISGIPFEAFDPIHCPNLRRFSAYERCWDVSLFLKANLDFTRKLGVSFEYVESINLPRDREPPLFPSLPFRMMDMTNKLFWSPASRLEDTCFGRSLSDLPRTNAESLEGLALELPRVGDEEAEDVIGSYKVETLDLVETVLGRLPKLSQLLVLDNAMARDRGAFTGAMKAATERLVISRPSLRYIGMFGRYWRVWRAGKQARMELEELDAREQADVELFSYTIYT